MNTEKVIKMIIATVLGGAIIVLSILLWVFSNSLKPAELSMEKMQKNMEVTETEMVEEAEEATEEELYKELDAFEITGEELILNGQNEEV